jgi:hypothetical protein
LPRRWRSRAAGGFFYDASCRLCDARASKDVLLSLLRLTPEQFFLAYHARRVHAEGALAETCCASTFGNQAAFRRTPVCKSDITSFSNIAAHTCPSGDSRRLRCARASPRAQFPASSSLRRRARARHPCGRPACGESTTLPSVAGEGSRTWTSRPAKSCPCRLSTGRDCKAFLRAVCRLRVQGVPADRRGERQAAGDGASGTVDFFEPLQAQVVFVQARLAFFPRFHTFAGLFGIIFRQRSQSIESGHVPSWELY